MDYIYDNNSVQPWNQTLPPKGSLKVLKYQKQERRYLNGLPPPPRVRAFTLRITKIPEFGRIFLVQHQNAFGN